MSVSDWKMTEFLLDDIKSVRVCRFYKDNSVYYYEVNKEYYNFAGKAHCEKLAREWFKNRLKELK